MQNRELKSELVNNGKYESFCLDKWENRKNGIYDDTPEMYDLTQEEFTACVQLRNAKNKSWSRLYDHIQFLGLKYGFHNVYFITITFNDETLALSQDTRKQYVRRMLQKNCSDYIANIDYGKQFEREHYHAVIVPDISKGFRSEKRDRKWRLVSSWLDRYSSKYGFYKVEQIRDCEDDHKKVCRYIAKLSNHSIKVKQSMIMTKKGSDYQWHVKHLQYGSYHSPVINTRDEQQAIYDNLVGLFGEDGLDVK